MNRLQSEVRRLYLPDASDGASALIDARGQVRALVMELAQPADWDVLAKVWLGVQDDLGLPAPAIAVSGTEGLQLWFSLSEAVSLSQGAAFLEHLRARYLAGVAAARVRLYPSEADPQRHAALVPACQAVTGNWSAFVAPGLAPVFADTPWLDIPPGTDGQAELLARLESIKPSAFESAMRRLQPPAPPVSAHQAPPAGPTVEGGDVDPRRFLQQVLNDEAAPLALRIEAAKALLQHSGQTPM